MQFKLLKLSAYTCIGAQVIALSLWLNEYGVGLLACCDVSDTCEHASFMFMIGLNTDLVVTIIFITRYTIH